MRKSRILYSIVLSLAFITACAHWTRQLCRNEFRPKSPLKSNLLPALNLLRRSRALIWPRASKPQANAPVADKPPTGRLTRLMYVRA